MSGLGQKGIVKQRISKFFKRWWLKMIKLEISSSHICFEKTSKSASYFQRENIDSYLSTSSVLYVWIMLCSRPKKVNLFWKSHVNMQTSRNYLNMMYKKPTASMLIQLPHQAINASRYIALGYIEYILIPITKTSIVCCHGSTITSNHQVPLFKWY